MDPGEHPQQLSRHFAHRRARRFCRGLDRFPAEPLPVCRVRADRYLGGIQFFDSQNARGGDLDPHDLLKAYHLREFDDDEQLKANTVARWENSDSEDLAELFMRNWSKGRSARCFGKDDTHLFKGINLDTAAAYPHAKQLRIVHHFVNAYNRQPGHGGDGRAMLCQFRLDQTIINGRRFFDMTAHYQERIASIGG